MSNTEVVELAILCARQSETFAKSLSLPVGENPTRLVEKMEVIMGFLSWIAFGIQIAKLIWQLWQLIHQIKKANPSFDTHDVVSELNQGIETYKKTQDSGPLTRLKEKLERHCEGIGCPADTKGLG